MNYNKNKKQGRRDDQIMFSQDLGYYGFVGIVLVLIILIFTL